MNPSLRPDQFSFSLPATDALRRPSRSCVQIWHPIPKTSCLTPPIDASKRSLQSKPALPTPIPSSGYHVFPFLALIQSP